MLAQQRSFQFNECTWGGGGISTNLAKPNLNAEGKDKSNHSQRGYPNGYIWTWKQKKNREKVITTPSGLGEKKSE